ncbi:MAG TPA: CoA transferase [Acidimicrobiales bacterium]|nr:CoA transferase [Acidimicrobiales bacterium]
MEDGILDGIRVIDMAESLGASVACLLLAESGADVAKIERPGEVAARALPGFRTWNRSKRSVVLDIETTRGRERLDSLLTAADVLVHEYTPPRAKMFGLDDETLAARFPQLIVSSVLSWPANHPDADRPVDELLAMARLGICDEQLPMRRDGPVFIRFPLGSWGAVYLAASGIVARLLVRGRGDAAGPAHTSLVQGAMVPMGMHWARAESPAPALAMGMPKESRGSQATVFECADGVWIHIMKNPDGVPLMQKLWADMGPERVAELNESAGDSAFGYPNRGANAAAFRLRPSDEWLHELWAHDVAVQPALPFGAIYDDEQALANRYVLELDDPEVGPITVGGLPLGIQPPQRVSRPTPRQGEHTAEVLAEWRRRPTAHTAPRRSTDRRRHPLDGVKVLDLGNYLAGPYGPMLLADLGADVVKVEATTGDAMRLVAWAFAGCQRGKRGVALDLKSPTTRPALEALVRWSDIVHHNLRMPAARRLGIDYESLHPVNPNMVYCHTTSYGPSGGRADWPGYDQLFQAQCGWEALGAGTGNPPMWHRFGFMDHQCALSSVLATLLALYRRDQTGEGQFVAASLLGAGALTASETYKNANGELAPFEVLDGDQTGTASGYRIVEVADGWIAVAARRPEQLAALCRVARTDDAGQVPTALRRRRSTDVLADLTAAGVPCEPVRENQRDAFFDDAANRAAGLVAEYRHAEWGRLEQPGALWYFGDLDVRLDYAPPALGEHTVEVLSEVGLPQAEIDHLIAEGVAKAL